MSIRTYKVTKASGFTLIEALIALAVFSFGLLAVAKFQAALVSSSAQSKARSEAVQLAQKKLDELRNYTTEQQLVANLEGTAPTITEADEFPTNVADGLYPSTAEVIEGNNADFSRQWQVACGAGSCSVVALVSWTDVQGNAQLATLDTEMTFKDPGGAADLTVNDFTPLVPSATGRAYLGDGTVTQAQLDGGTDNSDGTVSITNIGDDRVLVDENINDSGTYDIVLTLEDACVSGTCIDFVKISGRIYRDLGSAPGALLTDAYILASDAAYCARGASNTTDYTDYEYLDYTCYLGGGWHGNVGVVLTGNTTRNQDRVCLGDPSSPVTDDGDSTNNWRQMEMASRRAYRGMTFIGDASTGILPAGTLYYSQGIADAAELPDPGDRDGGGTLIANTDYRYYGHNYVMTSINGNPTGSDCLASLTRSDTDTNGDGTMGDLFYGTSTDFVCLNEERVAGAFKYLDTLDTGHYAKDFCPYDPSRGPALAYYVTGTVSVASPALLADTAILNSVSADNCDFVTNLNFLADNTQPITVQDVTNLSSAVYECLVYDWDSGWTGSVYVTEGFGLDCDPPIVVSTAITANLPNQDIACVTKLTPTISGTIKAHLNDLTGTTVQAVRVNANGTTTEVDCDVPVSGSGGDTVNYSCWVDEEDLGDGWIGTVTLTPADGIECDTTSWSWPGIAASLTAASYDTGTTYCRDPLVPSTLSVTVTGAVTGDGDLNTFGDITASGCNALDYGVDPTTATYRCVKTFAYNSTGWSGSVNLTIPTGMYCSPTSHSLSNVTTDDSWPATTSCELDVAGPVEIELTLNTVSLMAVWDKSTDLACTVKSSNTTTDIWVYTCKTPIIAAGATWSGYLGVTADPGKVICEDDDIPDGNPVSYTNIRPSSKLTLSLTAASNYVSCPP